jgi:hypothetical protein
MNCHRRRAGRPEGGSRRWGKNSEEQSSSGRALRRLHLAEPRPPAAAGPAVRLGRSLWPRPARLCVRAACAAPALLQLPLARAWAAQHCRPAPPSTRALGAARGRALLGPPLPALACALAWAGPALLSRHQSLGAARPSPPPATPQSLHRPPALAPAAHPWPRRSGPTPDHLHAGALCLELNRRREEGNGCRGRCVRGRKGAGKYSARGRIRPQWRRWRG